MRRAAKPGTSGKVHFPWFVLWFGAVILAQSVARLEGSARAHLIDLDTILLSSAMFALGVGTRWQQLRQAGNRPLLLAGVIFAGLAAGGWVMTRLLT